ncbi:MAG: YihY/virulence factor BrkB family protein [Lawsonibacter sp.]|nr:YihY/virulence factor BrkB family protein [Lawsonibacter sp.]
MKRILNLGPVRLGMDVLEAYHRCAATQAAAALAYFLVLTLFPLLMCVSYLIGLFHFDLEQLLLSLHRFFPPQALRVIRDYLAYAGQNQAPALLPAAVMTIVASASAGLRTLLHAMDRLYGREAARGPGRLVLSVALSVLFLLTIYLSVVVIFTGEWFFRLLERCLPRELAALIPALSGLWLWMRYLLLFCFMLLLVLSVYWLGAERRMRDWGLIAGAALTAAALVACSLAFSWFIGMSSRYSLVYGSLASLIILLAWLYFCGNILLLGAAAGKVFRERFGKKRG